LADDFGKYLANQITKNLRNIDPNIYVDLYMYVFDTLEEIWKPGCNNYNKHSSQKYIISIKVYRLLFCWEWARKSSNYSLE